MHPFFSSSSYHERKAEIMSKYRPIAPKPTPPSTTPTYTTLSRKRETSASCSIYAAASCEKKTKKKKNSRCLSLFPVHGRVIAPRAVRPVSSSISVRYIKEEEREMGCGGGEVKLPEEVEKEVEMEALPAVISDSRNRVRMTNSAYKELVGQPECAWVDSGRGGRVEGVVELRFCEEEIVMCEKGFSCWVAIQWTDYNKNEKKIKCVSTFCEAIRLSCVSRDYAFAWRFHTAHHLSPPF